MAAKSVTIAINTAVSTAIRTMGFHGKTKMNVQFQVGAWTAAAMYLQYSDDGTNWYYVVDGDNDLFGVLTADMVVDRWHTLIDVPAFHKFLRFVSAVDGAGSQTNQAAARTVRVHIDYVS